MGVPLEIRRVKRPVNTIVEDNGREGPNRYAVRERASIIYVPGGNPRPKNGRVIGHIINGQYVPIQTKTAENGPDMRSYGASVLVRSVSQDLYSDLLAVYPASDATAIMAIAALRVIKPGISAARMATQYQRTFVGIDFPGAALSSNSISSLLQKVGQDGGKRRLFYQRRVEAVSESHHIAIDGTLKQDSSEVNDLSAFSYKGRVKQRKEISVIYAYDIDLMEPICAEVFPGNYLDASAYRNFVRDNDIRKGLMIDDKGFPPGQIQEELKLRPDLHFLTPIKRNDKRIGNNNVLNWSGTLTGVNKTVLFNKCQIKGGRYLYAFKDVKKAELEEEAYLNRCGKNYDAQEYEKKRRTFGVIVFESDLDMAPEVAYKAYDDRWLLELVFKQYKSDECLDKTNVQGDFSVIGSEFVNFISTVATCRIIRKAREVGILDKMTYADMMDDLSEVWRMVDAPGDAASDDNYWVHPMKYALEELEMLGLSKPVPKPEPKRRGRPPKNPQVVKPKRPRGRPRKNPIS